MKKSEIYLGCVMTLMGCGPVSGEQLVESDDSFEAEGEDKSGAGWKKTTQFTKAEEAPDSFGKQVVLSKNGQTLVVGSPWMDGLLMRVYNKTRTGWSNPTFLNSGSIEDISNVVFGVSGDGKTIVAYSTGTEEGSGKLLLFKRSTSNGSFGSSKVLSKPLDASVGFGSDIDLNNTGNRFLVGSKDGKAYVYDMDARGQVSHKEIEKPSTAAETFGARVSISDRGDVFAVSNADASNFKGFVYREGRTYPLMIPVDAIPYPIVSDGDIAISGNGNVILLSDFSGESVYAYQFKNAAAGWTSIGTISRPSAFTRESFGTALGLSKDAKVAVIGAVGQTTWWPDGVPVQSGDVFIYGLNSRNNSSPFSMAKKIEQSSPSLGFGTTVSISSDGKQVGLGSHGLAFAVAK